MRRMCVKCLASRRGRKHEVTKGHEDGMGMHQRFLIIKPSAMGDVATTLPVLCDLKRVYPGAEIDWLIHPGLAGLVEGHDAIHEVIAFDRKRLASWWWKPSAFRAFWGLLRKLRGRRYDLVI